MMPSRTPEAQRLYWQKYRGERKPYAERACACGATFKPHGPQRKCDPCRTMTCGHCGKRWIPDTGRPAKFCSLSCSALGHPATLERLQANRGRKPRTYAKTRGKHGSAEDREWRKAVFERDGYTCQICHVKGGRLQADHIQPYAAYPDLRHDLSNGRTLCVDCHRKTPTYGWGAYWQERRRQEIAARRLSQEVLALGGAS